MELPILNAAAPVEAYEDPLEVMNEIDYLKKERDAAILAHFYVDGDLQDIADFTGDSLKLARDATKVTASTIVFCGVHFMGESAKILSPQKRVLITGGLFTRRQLSGRSTCCVPNGTPRQGTRFSDRRLYQHDSRGEITL